MNNFNRAVIRSLIIGVTLLLAPAHAQTLAPIVQVGTDAELGTSLADAEGRTLYTSSRDTQEASTCYGSCADVWQPVMIDRVFSTGAGADEALLGMTTRRDSYMQQLTYDGQPLCTFVGDYEVSYRSGHGLETFGGLWTVVPPDAKNPSPPLYANSRVP